MSKLSILLQSAAVAAALSWSAGAVAQSAANPARGGLHDPNQSPPAVALTPDERAWLDAHPDIVLGYAEGFEPEVIVESDGTYRGILVDILSEVNRRLGTNIRIEVGLFGRELDRIRKREVAGALAIHPDYARQMHLLPTRVYFEVYPAAFTLQGAVFDAPGALAGRRVALVEGAYYSKHLLDKYGVGTTTVRVQTNLDGLRSVLRREADVFIGRTTTSYLIAKYQLLGLVPQFIFHNDPVPGVAAIRADWPLLASILDKALASIPRGDIEALTARWMQTRLPQTVTPSPAEAAWLATQQPVRVLLPSFPPFVILDKQGPAGIAVDFLKLAGERTGIDFVFEVGRGPYREGVELMAEGRGADLVPLIVRDSQWGDRVAFSQEYVSSPRVIFTRVDSPFIAGIEDLRGRTIAVARDGDVETFLLRHSAQYADIRFQRRADDADALAALSRGDVDAYVGNLALASYLILEHGFSNVKVAAPSPLEDEKFRFGIRADRPELASLVDKGLQSMTPAERTSVLSRYLSVRYEQGLQWRQILPWAAGTLAVTVLVLAGVFVWNRALKRQVLERTAKLEESEFVARSTFDQAAVGMAHIAPSGRFLRVNRKLCEIVGYSEPELLERGFLEITYRDDRPIDEAIAAKLVAGEIDTDVREKRYVRKDGTIVWVERSVAVADAQRGAEPWLVVAMQDISARKQAEQAVLKHQRRLRELASQLARAEERERRIIAAELHDHVGQSLSAMRVLLAAARQDSVGGNGDARLEEVSECLRQAIRDTRDIMSSLSNPTLDRLGLSAAISEWLQSVGTQHNLDTRFTEEGQPQPLGADTSAMLFRCVRELVTNVVKHARASRLTVTLAWKAANAAVVVEDDGVGMDAGAATRAGAAGGGFGLFSIEERMADVGGSLTLVTSPGRGVTAWLVVPLEPVKQPAAV